MDAIIKQLQTCEIFRNLESSALELIAPLASRKQVATGTVLFHRGDPRDSFYVILKGYLELTVGSVENVQRLVIIGPGESLGEAGLMEGGRHATTGRARTDLVLLKLPIAKLRKRLASDAEVAMELFAGITRFLLQRMQTTTSSATGWELIYCRGTYRWEHDLLGKHEVPEDALYGIQTQRALENFPITRIRLAHFPRLVVALAMVKQAAARANRRLGLLPQEMASAIERACAEIVDGHWHQHFVVDMVQGGAGTSTNMNANEVIANRALELLGHHRGDYQHCHPLNHVNRSQSTNDVYPTAVRVAIINKLQELVAGLEDLRQALVDKGFELNHVIKMGRTQLQDAVPMTLGQEFNAFAETTAEDIARLKEISRLFLEVNLGGTAIGTGITADPRYPELAVEELKRLSGLELCLAHNLVEATPDTGAFVLFSGMLKRVAVKLSKLCNDLRLLSSGPRCGLNEINLPPVQPGSSIMPGKVNPVIPEVVNQIAFQVIGNDLTITIAAEAGQLQLNVMEPIITFNLFESLEMLTSAITVLTNRCIRGITANPERCREMVESSIGIVTALVPALGYERASEVATEALNTNRSVRDIVLASGDLTNDQLERLLSPESMTSSRPQTKE